MQNDNQTIEPTLPLWVTAQSKENKDKFQKAKNTLTKKHYFEILEQIKMLYKQHGNELAFERDYTKHPSEKPNAMHCFLTNNVYWQLSCTDDHNFVVYHNACNLIFMAELNKMVYFLPKNVRVVVLVEIPVTTMFKRCKRLQDDKFFYNL